MTRTKKLGIGLALAALAALPIAALADGEITINPGPLTVFLPDFVFPAASFDSVNPQTSQTIYVIGDVNDSDGFADGWNVTVLAGDFETAPAAADGWAVSSLGNGLRIDMPTGAINTGRLSGVGGDAQSLVNGGLWPALDSTTPLAVLECDPAGVCTGGDGTFEFRPRFRTEIPGGQTPGTYFTVLTVDVIQGP